MSKFDQLKRQKLCELILRLPSHQVAASHASAGVGADILNADRDHPIEHSLRNALENLETSNSFVMVRKPETDSEFLGIYSHLQTQLEELADSIGTTIKNSTMFLFLASPGAITPFHLDKYSAFLLQLSGKKKVHIWSPWEHDKLEQEEIEAFVSSSIPRTPAIEDLSGSMEHTIQSGDGVHIPCVSPHWVENGDEVSISISVHFTTARSNQKLNALRMNDLARRWFKAKPSQVTENGSPIEWCKAKSFVALSNLRSRTKQVMHRSK
jgi:ribosomal protein L16 Arg81 hydroxylase